jgi:hypothetical protein
LAEKLGCRDRETRILRVMRVGEVVAAQGTQEREDMFANDGVHLGRGEVLDTRPTEVVAGAALGIVATPSAPSTP